MPGVQRGDARIQHFRKIDVLINHAGEQHVKESLEEISAEQLEKTFRTNVFSFFYMTGQTIHVNGGTVVNG